MKRPTFASAMLALAAAFAACGEGDHGGPVPAVLGGDDDPAASAPVDGVIKRTVSQRNPYGNVAATDNLLWDGDFEFRPSFPEQYGWLIGSSFGATFGLPDLATGSRCRSGIKCALLAPGRTILGIAVGSEGRELEVSFWAFPDSGVCTEVNAAFISAADDVSPSDRIDPVQSEPAEDGWCRFEIVTPARTDAAYLSIGNQSATLLVVDDAVVRPIDASEQKARSLRRAERLSPAEEQRYVLLRESAKKVRMPRRTPPSRGAMKLSAHLTRMMR